MIFIYDDESLAVLPRRVNGRDGVAVQLCPSDDGFGTDDYNDYELLFESHAIALEWARKLLADLTAPLLVDPREEAKK